MRLIDSTIGDFDRLAKGFRWHVPSRFNIAQLCCDRHSDRAGQIAIYYENAGGDRKSLNYGQLIRYSNQIGRAHV